MFHARALSLSLSLSLMRHFIWKSEQIIMHLQKYHFTRIMYQIPRKNEAIHKNKKSL